MLSGQKMEFRIIDFTVRVGFIFNFWKSDIQSKLMNEAAPEDNSLFCLSHLLDEINLHVGNFLSLNCLQWKFR